MGLWTIVGGDLHASLCKANFNPTFKACLASLFCLKDPRQQEYAKSCVDFFSSVAGDEAAGVGVAEILVSLMNRFVFPVN